MITVTENDKIIKVVTCATVNDLSPARHTHTDLSCMSIVLRSQFLYLYYFRSAGEMVWVRGMGWLDG